MGAFEMTTKKDAKVLNPDGRMTIRALFYNAVDGIAVIDNTSGALHEAGEVLDMACICGTDALKHTWKLQDTLKQMGLRLEAVAEGRKRR
jgi:hypothetical protein